MPDGMQERAARSAFNAFYGPGAFMWGHVPDEERDEWRVVSAAVLAVVADVDEIADGIEFAADATWCFTGQDQHDPKLAREIAEAVVAHLLDKS